MSRTYRSLKTNKDSLRWLQLGFEFREWLHLSVYVPLSIEYQHFEAGSKSVHDHGKKEDGTSLKERVRVIFHSIEDRAKNESTDGVAEKLRKCQGWIAFEGLESSPETELDLLPI